MPPSAMSATPRSPLAAAAHVAAAVLRAPLWAAGVAGSDKSFARNPILGSPALNRWGLHVGRMRLADALARRRRRALGRTLDAADRAALDRDGYVLKRDFLPPTAFAALTAELAAARLEAWELRQGQAVQRMAPLGGDVLRRHPALAALVADRTLRALMRYGASRGGEPVAYIQTVIAQPDGPADPQTALHADTFHSTTKGWFYLHDVAAEEGPFVYAPGSHRLTPERLAWERRQSETARDARDPHHAAGSFRIAAEDVAALGYGPPTALAVPANSLLIADTLGFHARARSERASTRVALHVTLRRNPFPPWTGLDLKSAPGLRGRELDLYLGWTQLQRRLTGRGAPWRPVGAVAVDAPAQG